MKKAKEYRVLFNEIYNSGDEIVNKTTGETFIAEDGEEFRQCWADTPTRREFPKYWFISKKGNLLSVKKDRIQWLHKNKRPNSNKISYKFLHETADGARNRNVEEHNLVGLVWGARAFGRATELMEEKGLDAFGVNSNTDVVAQGHHISHDDTDNTPENILFVTDKVHSTVLEKPFKHHASPEKDVIHMREVIDVLKEENPDEITVIFDGIVYDKKTKTLSETGESNVFSAKKLRVDPEFAAQFQAICRFLDNN